MIKRMIILIVMGLTLSSCDFIHYGKIAIQDNVRRIEMEREKKSVMKKDGPAAIDVDEYKEGVEEAIKDVLKRPINKKVEFKGTTLIIPEGTRINPHCISKKVNNREYGFFFDKHDVNINKIAKEIMRVNGFEDVCR